MIGLIVFESPVDFHKPFDFRQQLLSLHRLGYETGEPVARVRASGSAVTSAPVAIGNRLCVQGDDGSLSAYLIPQPSRESDAPDIADDGS